MNAHALQGKEGCRSQEGLEGAPQVDEEASSPEKIDRGCIDSVQECEAAAVDVCKAPENCKALGEEVRNESSQEENKEITEQHDAG